MLCNAVAQAAVKENGNLNAIKRVFAITGRPPELRGRNREIYLFAPCTPGSLAGKRTVWGI